jgi:hypothetical protein
MSDISVPTAGQWSLADERSTLTGYSQAAGADGPLSRAELAAFSIELGDRRSTWMDACELHLADLMRNHRGGGWR